MDENELNAMCKRVIAVMAREFPEETDKVFSAMMVIAGQQAARNPESTCEEFIRASAVLIRAGFETVRSVMPKGNA